MPKKRARKRNTWIIFLLLCIVFVLAGFCCLLLLRLNRAAEQDVTGSWRMRLDLTDHARTCANLWLGEAFLGDRVDAGGSLPRLGTDVVLTLNADGSWSRRVDRAGLEAAEKQAVAAAAKSLRALLLLRIEDAGRRPCGEAEAEERIRQAIGMSTEDYLSRRGPRLLPAPEELEARWNGSGSWQVSGQRLVFDGGRGFDFALAGRLLILSGEEGTEVYARD